MHGKTRKIVSLMAAIALLVTCTISGLVLPVAAEDPAAVENLVPNGDFEEGAAATWTGVNELITVEDGVGFGGSKGLQFADGGAAEIYWKSFVPTLEANSVYELTFLAKGPKIRLAINSTTDVTMGTVYAELLPSQWTVYRAVIRTGTNPSIDANWGMYFRRDSSATEPTYVDNVVMKKWDGNVICGGEFDVVPYHFAGPHFANGAATIETEADGNNAMLIPASTSALGDKFLKGLSDTIEASTDYVLSMDVKGAPINVYVYGGGGATGGVTGVWNVTAQSDEYRHYTYEFTTTDSLNTDWLINITRNTAETLNTATGTYIDNVMLVKKVDATDITLNQSTADLLVGDTLTLTATAAPAGSYFAEEVVWSTTDPAVATVDNGTVTAVGKGTATITATAGELSASCTVTVTKPQATAIALDKTAVTLRVGATDTLTVTTVPENAEYDTVVWSTSDAAVATVENGVVTAVTEGTATITATSGTLTATCVVTVDNNLLPLGDFQDASAPYSNSALWDIYAGGSIVDDPAGTEGNKVLELPTSFGEHYGKWNKLWNADAGVYNTTMSLGKKYTISFKVYGDALAVYFSGNAYQVVDNNAVKGQGADGWFQCGDGTEAWTEYHFTVYVKETASSAHTDWHSWYNAFAKKDNGYGSTAAATYIDDFRIVEVIEIPATDIELNETTADLLVGDTLTLTATPLPAGSTFMEDVVWTTTNAAAATVENGVVTAVGAGTATITATAGTLSASCVVTVTKRPATAITLNTTAATVVVGDTLPLVVTPVPVGADYADVVWTTSKDSVATVTQSGVVTAVGAGTATITATSGSLAPVTCVVTVTTDKILWTETYETADTRVGALNGWLNAGTLTVDPQNSGNRVLKLNNALNAEYNGGGNMGMVANKVYALEVSAYGTGTFKLQCNGSKGLTGALAQTYTLGAAWTTYTYYFVTGSTVSNDGYMLYITTSSADVYLDNIRLRELGGATDVNTLSSGLLPGGDFEMTNSDNWAEIVNGGAEIVADPTGADNKVLHFPSSYGNGAYWYNMNLKLAASSTYIMTMDVYGSDVWLYVNGANGLLTAAGTSAGWVKIAGEGETWTTASVVIKTNANPKIDTYMVGFGRASTTIGGLYVDNIRVTKAADPESITLVPDTLDLVVGGTDTLEIAATPTGAYLPTVTWTTENASVATVENGVVTAVGAGTTTITATAGTLSASCVVTVTKPQATALNLDKQALTLFMGNTVTLNASFQPADSLHGELVWSVSDDSVITVDQNGKVTAVGPGTATVGVTDGNLSATCGVTVLSDLVIGGDFEASDTNGIGMFANVKENSTTWYIAPGQGVGGGNALAINYQRSDRWLVWPSFQPNTTYAVSFLAKGPEIMFQLYKYSGTSDFTTKYTENYGDGWVYYCVEFTTGDSFGADPSSAGYGFLLNRPATLEDTTAVTYVDNFSIVETDKSDERLPGGDFEVAVPEQLIRYHLNNGFAQVVAETDGNHALYVPELTADPGDYYMFGVKAQPNTEYVFSFKAKGAPIAFYSKYFGWKATQQSDDYVTYAYKFTTDDSVNEHYLINMTRADECKETLGTTTGTYIDDISLKPASSDLIAEEMVMPGVSGTVKPGDAVIFGVTVKNEGTVAVEGEFPIEFRVNGTTWYEMTYNASIAPGATVTVLSDKAWTAVEGDYAISVKINSTMAVHDASLTNNTAGCELHVASAAPVAPDYAQNAGFDNLTFSDDFNSIDTIDMNATGEAGYKWYVRRPYGATTVTGSDLTVAGGILTLKLSDPTFNYGIGTIDPRTGNGFSFNQGYMEIRFRIPDSSILGDNEQGVPAIWSLPPEKIMGASNAWVEMDWMEFWGKGLKHFRYPKGYYTITMHDQALNADGTTAHWYKNGGYSQNGLGDQEWHTMGWLWEEGKITAYLDGTQVMSQAYSADSTGTPTAYAATGTLENGVFTGMNTLMQSLILGGSADRPLEVDYVRIWQKAEAETPYIYADTTTEGGKIDFGETGVMAEAEENTIVSVNAKPTEGYIMKPGSLKYITKEGTEVKILNQSLTDMTFGGGDGYSFEFKAPADIAKVTAEFIPTTSQTFAIDTVGTALRVAQGGVGYDGIRFLTRMNLATTFDPATNALMVTYEGVNYEVIELGSLLKRAENANELTMENFETSTTGINRMWKSKAYTKGGGMSLVDYTDSYIDFTVVMTKGASISSETFNARQYTARGYIILQDENGTQKTVLCDTQLTNSVNGASSAL